MILGLSIAGWITVITLVALAVMFTTSKTAPELLYLGAVAVLLLTGAVSEETALSGFSSESVITTGAEGIMVVGLAQSGVLMWVVQRLMGRTKGKKLSMLKVMAPAAAVSSVMANAAVAAMFVKIVKAWSKKIKVPQSKLLIPMAYAALMGGSLTLIGTPANIVISGLYSEETGDKLGMFVITLPGLLCLMAGMISLFLLYRLLPERKSPDDNFESTGDYTVEFLVPTENAAVGQTVMEAGLNNVPGGRLIEIVRFDKEVISPVSADEFILGGDHLVYSGEVDEILNLKRTHGLVNANRHVFSVNEVDKTRKLRTATVVYNSSLVGARISETDFEESHNMILVAVSRGGSRIDESPREIRLEPDDTLLLECPPNSTGQTDDELRRDLRFFDSDDTVVIGRKTVVAGLVLLAMVLLHVTHVLSVVQSCMLAAMAMLTLNCCSSERARKSIEWDILIIIACSVVFGKALLDNGVVDAVVGGVGRLSGDSPLLMMSVLCAGIMIVTEFFSNTVVSAVAFPVVFNSAAGMGYDPLPFCIAMMLAVSTSYASPMGSPVMLMIYGPGGYRFRDFIKIGIPMKLIMLVTILLVVNLLYPLT